MIIVLKNKHNYQNDDVFLYVCANEPKWAEEIEHQSSAALVEVNPSNEMKEECITYEGRYFLLFLTDRSRCLSQFIGRIRPRFFIYNEDMSKKIAKGTFNDILNFGYWSDLFTYAARN